MKLHHYLFVIFNPIIFNISIDSFSLNILSLSLPHLQQIIKRRNAILKMYILGFSDFLYLIHQIEFIYFIVHIFVLFSSFHIRNKSKPY